MYKISTAVSAVLATAAFGAAGVASAAPLVSAADHFFPTSGSTALDNAIKEYFLLSGGICTGSINVYIDGTNTTTASLTTSVHNTLVVCQSTASFGTVSAGDTIGLGKESNAGSLEGTLNVARGTSTTAPAAQTLAFIDAIASAGVTCTATQSIPAGTNYPHAQAYTLHYGCGVTGAYVPQIGWADERPEIWSLYGDRKVTTGDLSALNTTPLVQNVFGIAVSLNTYRSLQAMQGLTQDDTLAHMPSLSSSVIQGLYNGSLDWSVVTNSAGTPVTSFGTAPKSSTAFVCRRGDSSGTNAFVDLQFFSNRCTFVNGSALNVAQSRTGGTTNGNCSGLPAGLNSYDFGCAWTSANLTDQVFFGSGGGDVASCLDRHNNNNDFAIGNLTTNQAFGAATATTTNSHFRFVAIHNRKPNLTSVANGSYPFVEDDVLNVKKSASNGNVSSLASYITSTTTGFANTTIVADFEGKQTASGDTDWNYGVLFDAFSPNVPSTTPSYPLSTTEVATYPVSSYTQLLSTAGLNNCQPPISTQQTINQ